MTVNLEAVKAAQCVQKQLKPVSGRPWNSPKETHPPLLMYTPSKQMFMNIWSLLLEMKHVCDVEVDLVSSFTGNIKEWTRDYLKKSREWKQRGLSLWFSGWNVSNAPSWDQERRRGMKGWREECSNKTIRDRKWPWLQQDVESAAMMSSLASPAKHESKHTHTLLKQR